MERDLLEMDEVDFYLGANQQEARSGVVASVAPVTEMRVGDDRKPVFGYRFEDEEGGDGQAEKDFH